MKVSIFGAAGTIGSCAAYRIALLDLVDELVLLDPNDKLLSFHALDIRTSITGLSRTRVVAGGDEELQDSDIVIIAAGIPVKQVESRRENFLRHLEMICSIAKKIEHHCSKAVVITVTNPIDPLNYGIYCCTNLEKKQLIGFSLNDSIRFRVAVARALNANPAAVECTAIGEHGKSHVLLFSSIRVNGQPMTISDEAKRDVLRQIAETWQFLDSMIHVRTSGWTTASGLASMVSSISQEIESRMPCSAVLDGEYGCSGLSMGVPVVFDRTGIRQIIELDLWPDEQSELMKSAERLKQWSEVIEKIALK